MTAMENFTVRDYTKREPAFDLQRHHSRRRLRYASAPHHLIGQQTAVAGVRQTHDLLPDLGIDAGRDS